MKLTEEKLKNTIKEVLSEGTSFVHPFVKQSTLATLENAIDSVPEDSPLFPFKDKLKETMNAPAWPLEGLRHTHSFLDALTPGSRVEQMFKTAIDEAHFYLEVKGYDRNGNRIPGSSLLKKIEDKINEIMLENRVEMKKMFDPVEIGKHSNLKLLLKVEDYIRSKLQEDPEIAEIFEKADRLLKGSASAYFNNSIMDAIQFSGLFPNLSQTHYQYPN